MFFYIQYNSKLWQEQVTCWTAAIDVLPVEVMYLQAIITTLDRLIHTILRSLGIINKYAKNSKPNSNDVKQLLGNLVVLWSFVCLFVYCQKIVAVGNNMLNSAFSICFLLSSVSSVFRKSRTYNFGLTVCNSKTRLQSL